MHFDADPLARFGNRIHVDAPDVLSLCNHKWREGVAVADQFFDFSPAGQGQRASDQGQSTWNEAGVAVHEYRCVQGVTGEAILPLSRQPCSRPQGLVHYRLGALAVEVGFELPLLIKGLARAAQRKLLGADPALQVLQQRVQVAE